MHKIILLFTLFALFITHETNAGFSTINDFELIQNDDTTYLIHLNGKDYPHIQERVISADLHWKNCSPAFGISDLKETFIFQHTVNEDTLIMYLQNNSEDTFLLFGTLLNMNFFINRRCIKKEENKILIDVSANNEPEKLYSGMRTMQFYVIPPNCRIQFEITLEKINQLFNISKNDSVEYEIFCSYYNLSDVIVHTMDDQILFGYMYERNGNIVNSELITTSLDK